MKANRLGDVVHTDKTTCRKDERLVLHAGKNITNSSIQEVKNSLCANTTHVQILLYLSLYNMSLVRIEHESVKKTNNFRFVFGG